jgi:hypothetical protein
LSEQEQYQLFDTPEYSYRVFMTNMKESVDLLAWFSTSGPERRI